jgi:hypothetical protein
VAYNLLLVKIAHRSSAASEVQRILTEFGRIIRTRLGLHETSPEGYCAEDGLVILELRGGEEDTRTLAETLSRIPGVTVRAVHM